VINKSTVSDKEKRRGRKGYWVVLIDRLLVYSILLEYIGVFSNISNTRDNRLLFNGEESLFTNCIEINI